jgi:hypothetical protein
VIRLAVGLLWSGAVLGGIVALERYKAAPSAQAEAPEQWPAGSALGRDAAKPTLLVFAHPKCPCTRATMKELARLAARLGPAVFVQVELVKPEGTGVDWPKTDLWAQAAAIPGARVAVDDRGVEARRFGSSTSGQVLLYAPGGELLFHGGITIARGHEGDGPGAERIAELVKTGHTALAEAPVFGCPLHDEGAK